MALHVCVCLFVYCYHYCLFCVEFLSIKWKLFHEQGEYEPGKRHWLKVKKDYLAEGAMADTADLVVLGAYFGTGNKGLYVIMSSVKHLFLNAHNHPAEVYHFVSHCCLVTWLW